MNNAAQKQKNNKILGYFVIPLFLVLGTYLVYSSLHTILYYNSLSNNGIHTVGTIIGRDTESCFMVTKASTPCYQYHVRVDSISEDTFTFTNQFTTTTQYSPGEEVPVSYLKENSGIQAIINKPLEVDIENYSFIGGGIFSVIFALYYLKKVLFDWK